MEAKILVVDDEEDVLAFVLPTLENEGYDVIKASEGSEAIIKWRDECPDLIVLDIKMPGMSGIDVLREIRRDDKTIPIVMLTSLDEIFDQQTAIKWGASQWVSKSERELLRDWVNAELKQLRQAKLECEDLKINFDAMKVNVKRDDEWKERHLEPNERELLFFLAHRQGKVQKKGKLNKRVFGKEAGEKGEGSLAKTVSTLRKKIEPVPAEPKYIRTVSGEGYRFDA